MSSANRPLYRTRQFIGALRPRVRDLEYAEVREVLGAELIPLFDSMTPRDRRHCIDVYKKMRDGGYDDPDVLVAALLHDAGKGSLAGTKVRLWHRVAYVLLHASSPSLLDRLSRNGGLSVLRHHAEIGARLAGTMGASPHVVQIILEHEHKEHEDPAQAALRAADDDS